MLQISWNFLFREVNVEQVQFLSESPVASAEPFDDADHVRNSESKEQR
jgi:hypothetical protein